VPRFISAMYQILVGLSKEKAGVFDKGFNKNPQPLG
jgi:hypothetical protein